MINYKEFWQSSLNVFNRYTDCNICGKTNKNMKYARYQFTYIFVVKAKYSEKKNDKLKYLL